MSPATTMDAVLHRAYAPVEVALRTEPVAIPPISSQEVLVAVRAAAVAGDDWHLVEAGHTSRGCRPGSVARGG